MHLLYRRRLDEHAKQCSVGVRQEHWLDPCACGEALEERARAAVRPLEMRVRREVRTERREFLQIRCRRTVADKDCLWVRTVSACRYAALTAEVLCRRRCGGGGRRERSKGVVHELAEQARVDTCADNRDVFLRERSVCEGPRIFRG